MATLNSLLIVTQEHSRMSVFCLSNFYENEKAKLKIFMIEKYNRKKKIVFSMKSFKMHIIYIT